MTRSVNCPRCLPGVQSTVVTKLLVIGMCLLVLVDSSAFGFTLPAPIDHDWPVKGCGLRSYTGRYTEAVFGSHHHIFHLPFLTVVAVAGVVAGASVLLGAAATWVVDKRVG